MGDQLNMDDLKTTLLKIKEIILDPNHEKRHEELKTLSTHFFNTAYGDIETFHYSDPLGIIDEFRLNFGKYIDRGIYKEPGFYVYLKSSDRCPECLKSFFQNIHDFKIRFVMNYIFGHRGSEDFIHVNLRSFTNSLTVPDKFSEYVVSQTGIKGMKSDMIDNNPLPQILDIDTFTGRDHIIDEYCILESIITLNNEYQTHLLNIYFQQIFDIDIPNKEDSIKVVDNFCEAIRNMYFNTIEDPLGRMYLRHLDRSIFKTLFSYGYKLTISEFLITCCDLGNFKLINEECLMVFIQFGIITPNNIKNLLESFITEPENKKEIENRKYLLHYLMHNKKLDIHSGVVFTAQQQEDIFKIVKTCYEKFNNTMIILHKKLGTHLLSKQDILNNSVTIITSSDIVIRNLYLYKVALLTQNTAEQEKRKRNILYAKKNHIGYKKGEEGYKYWNDNCVKLWNSIVDSIKE